MRRLLTILSACYNAKETIGCACLSVDAQVLPPDLKIGGMSNRSLRHRWLAHQMDCRAWTENKLSPGFLTLPPKPLRKLPQFWRRRKNFIFPDWADSTF